MLNQILLNVQKPARYIAKELNSCMKDKNSVSIRYAFCFPDVYEVGMSHLGLKILYHLMNQRQDTFCERVFAPWMDMETQMRENNIDLFALESRDPLTSFHILGFTLQYEMSYTNVLNMLSLAGIPLLSADRDDSFPLICAGGPCTVNPEPMADFIDFFVIGEAEELIHEILDTYVKCEQKNKPFILEQLSKIDGIYVPSISNSPVKRRFVKDLDSAYFPNDLIVPFIEIIHDRLSLEVFRGCTRGCRFCQAGMIYRPKREKKVETLLAQAKSLLANTGYEELSLCSLSASDYSRIDELLTELIHLTEKEKVNLAMPSLRVDSFSETIVNHLTKVRKAGLTFAPEAGSQRLRDIIHKKVTEQDLMDTCKIAFAAGYTTIKLYFMIGLPHETDEDILEIAQLAKKVLDLFYKTPKRASTIRINISVSTFVPKPHTPFQWEKQNDISEIQRKQTLLKSAVNQRQVKLSFHDPRLSHLEGVFARGDRRLGEVLLNAHKLGCRFDAWSEAFNYDLWQEAFSLANVDPLYYTRKIDFNELLPWSVIDPLVPIEFLVKENKEAALRSNQCLNT